MGLYVGSSALSKVYIGSLAVSKVYEGSNLVYTADSGPVHEGGDITEDTILAAAEVMATADATGPAAGGTLTINGISLENYDYCVIDGNLTITDASAMSNYFTATEDARSAWLIVKGDLTIDAGGVLTPGVRKLFTVVYATGTLTVNGEISMSNKGANHSAFTPTGAMAIAGASYTSPVVPVAGGSGGANRTTAGQNPGSAGSGGGTGGGGSGGRATAGSSTAGGGADGSMFAGGPGGGGGCESGASSGVGVANGGAGGDGRTGSSSNDRGAGGGGGNPGGTAAVTGLEPATAEDGEDGCAGTLIVICNNLAGNGTLSANGPKGGDSHSFFGIERSAGGGGGGGGHVTALVKVSDTSTITAEALGGAGGTATRTGNDGGEEPQDGGDGGDGTARILEAA